MALAGQIEAAARGVSSARPVGNDMGGEALLAMPSLTSAEMGAQREGAEQMVRRIANRHDCDGMCDRTEHARDAAAMTFMLAVLGLSDAEVPTFIVGDPVSVEPIVLRRPTSKRCTRCGESKPGDGFYARRSECKTCHQQVNSANQARRRQSKPADGPRTGRPMKPRTRPAEKKCSACAETLPSAAFYADGRAPDGLRSECRDCFNAKRRRTGVAA